MNRYPISMNIQTLPQDVVKLFLEWALQQQSSDVLNLTSTCRLWRTLGDEPRQKYLVKRFLQKIAAEHKAFKDNVSNKYSENKTNKNTATSSFRVKDSDMIQLVRQANEISKQVALNWSELVKGKYLPVLEQLAKNNYYAQVVLYNAHLGSLLNNCIPIEPADDCQIYQNLIAPTERDLLKGYFYLLRIRDKYKMYYESVLQEILANETTVALRLNKILQATSHNLPIPIMEADFNKPALLEKVGATFSLRLI